MSDLEWVTIQTCSWLQEAQLMRTQLEASGIEVLIPEEHAVSAASFITAMNIRVQVRKAQEKEARDLLGQSPESKAEEKGCPRCGGVRFTEAPARSKNRFFALLGFIVGVPMRGTFRKKCAKCGV